MSGLGQGRYGDGRGPRDAREIDDADRALDRLIADAGDALPPLDFARQVMASVDAYEERWRLAAQAGWVVAIASTLAFAAFAAAPQSPMLWGMGLVSATVDGVLGAAAAVRGVLAAGLVLAIPAAAATLFLLAAYARFVAGPGPAPRTVEARS
jgi:hypothetical protein